MERPERKGRVLFEHIPQKHDKQAVELATPVTVAYIKALADDKAVDA